MSGWIIVQRAWLSITPPPEGIGLVATVPCVAVYAGRMKHVYGFTQREDIGAANDS